MILLTRPPSTISTTSMVSSSVTRIPCTNSPSSKAGEHLIDLRPPPWDHTGFIPTSLKQHDIARERSLQPLVGHGVTAVLHDDRFAIEVGGCTASASARIVVAPCGR
jgi:hypothetical protein